MTGSCCNKRVLILGLITAVLTWAFDFLMHGVIFKSLYTTYAHLFRPESEMMDYMHWCIAYHLVMGVLVAAGYRALRDKSVVTQGLCFGLWVGLLLGIPQLMVVVWMAMPMELPLMWCATEIAKWVLAGLVLGKLYKPAMVS